MRFEVIKMSNGQQTPLPQTQQPAQQVAIAQHDISSGRPITYFDPATGKPAGVTSSGGTFYSVGANENLLFRTSQEAQQYASSQGKTGQQVGVSNVPSSDYWRQQEAEQSYRKAQFGVHDVKQPISAKILSEMGYLDTTIEKRVPQFIEQRPGEIGQVRIGEIVQLPGKKLVGTPTGTEIYTTIPETTAPKPPLFDPITGKPNIYFTSPSTQPEFIRDTKYGLMVRGDLVKPSQYDVNVVFDKTMNYLDNAEKQASATIKSYVPEPIKGAYRGVMKSLDVYSDLPFTSPIEKQTIQFGKGMIEGIPERPITTGVSLLVGGVTGKLSKSALEAFPILKESLPLVGRIPKIGSKITPANIGSLGLLGVYGSDVATRAAAAPKPAEELGKITSSEILPFGTGMKLGERVEITKNIKSAFGIKPSVKELMTPEISEVYKQVSPKRQIKIESALRLTEALKTAPFEQMKPVNLETVKYGGKIAPGLKEMMKGQPEGYVIGGSTSVGAFVKGFRPGADIDLYAKNYPKAVKEISVESKIKYPGAEIAEKGSMATISSKEGHTIIDIHPYEDIQRSIASTISKQTTGKLYKPIDIKGTQYINPKLQLAAKAEGTIRALEEEAKTGKLGGREKDIADFEAIAESLIKGMPTAQRAKLFKELESYKLHSGIPAEYAYELSKPYAKYLLENVRAKPAIPYGYLQSVLKGKYPSYYEPSLKAGKGGYYEPSLVPGNRGYYPATKPSKGEYYPSTKEAAQYYHTSIYPSSKYPATTEYYPIVKPSDVFKATIPTEPKIKGPDRTLFKLPYFEQVPTGKKKGKKQRYNRLLKLYPIGPSSNILKAFSMKTRTAKKKTRSKRKK